MNKPFLRILFICLIFLSASFVCGWEARAVSYMSDKTEIPVNLEVSGAEALCQTADGYVWIAQYSGLTRYDSKEFVTYKRFEYNGNEYNILNVTGLAARGNDLFVATSDHVFVYKDYHFEPLVKVDQANKMLYSEEDQILFVAGDVNGLYCIDFSSGEPVTTLAGNLDNKSQLMDLMIDYEGNLWISRKKPNTNISSQARRSFTLPIRWTSTA